MQANCSLLIFVMFLGRDDDSNLCIIYMVHAFIRATSIKLHPGSGTVLLQLVSYRIPGTRYVIRLKSS